MIRLAENKGVWVTGQNQPVPPEDRVRIDVPEKPERVGYRFYAPRKYSSDAVLYGVEKRAEREEEDEPDY